MTISTDLSLLHDPRRQARLLFWQGFSVPQIADTLQVKRPTVQSWKQRDGWEETAPLNRVETTLEARLIQLYAKPDLTPHDFKVADFLSRQMERFARINRYGQTGNEVDLNPNIASRNKGIAKSRNAIISATRPSKSWKRFSSISPLSISSTGTRPVSRTVFATSSNHARLARRSTLRVSPSCVRLRPGKTRYFCQPVRRRLTCSESTSSPLRAWSTSTCQETRLSSATTAQS